MVATVVEQQIQVNGNTVAGVTVEDDGADVSMRVYVAGGPVPSTALRALMDATFSLPAFDPSRHVHAAVPLGDAELLTGLSRHLDSMHTRAAGSTCLVDGIVATEATA